MIVWALVLIAVGVGALLDVSIWPGVLIAMGVSTLLSVAFKGNRETARLFNCWPCWPTFYPQDSEDTTRPRRSEILLVLARTGQPGILIDRSRTGASVFFVI